MPGSLHILKGIAPNANLLDLRVLDKNGASTDSEVIAAIQQAVQLKSKYNVRVINLSLGRPIYESCNRDPLCQAVEAAWRNGIVVVIAAGNLGRNGYATVHLSGQQPACHHCRLHENAGDLSSQRRPDRELQLARVRPTSIRQ